MTHPSERHLSASQLNMFLRCPKQWEFRYVEGIKIPPAGAMVQGSVYHETLAQALGNRGTVEKWLDREVADMYSTIFDKAIQDEPEINWEDSPGKLKDEGIKLAQLYCDTELDNLNPVAIEQEKHGMINEIEFIYIMDVEEEDKIVDHKLKKKRFSEKELADDIQATAYTYFERKPLEFHQALKQKQPQIVIAPTRRGNNDLYFFEYLVLQIWDNIQAGVFVPNITSWSCSPQWCGYWSMCRGK